MVQSREEIDQMIRLSTVFVSGRDGYYELTGEKDCREGNANSSGEISGKRRRNLYGGDEASVWFDGQEYGVPAYLIDPVDTTGSGRLLSGRPLYAYFAEHQEKEEALAFANASAAVKMPSVRTKKSCRRRRN